MNEKRNNQVGTAQEKKIKNQNQPAPTNLFFFPPVRPPPPNKKEKDQKKRESPALYRSREEKIRKESQPPLPITIEEMIEMDKRV